MKYTFTPGQHVIVDAETSPRAGEVLYVYPALDGQPIYDIRLLGDNDEMLGGVPERRLSLASPHGESGAR
jgi:hypothetical protein